MASEPSAAKLACKAAAPCGLAGQLSTAQVWGPTDTPSLFVRAQMTRHDFQMVYPPSPVWRNSQSCQLEQKHFSLTGK
ncbi:MAG: hypothetical protein FRX49_09539 [Trebouxia sp. A1-2]|nr:MAG: hypothetical protein FRX49_09539 [Trebouxia sp. A1-2]